MRELQLWQADEGLEDAFTDISSYAMNCRFTDCTHTQEKGCAVIAALDSVEITRERYQNFLKLQKELNYLSMQTDKAGFLAHKKYIKGIHK
jgi:ribosome biogenesis GTPase / thiamine phosphate phosphatase